MRQDAAEQEHDEKLRLFVNRCRQKNIKLNADKFELRVKEAAYIGYLLTTDGLKIDPEKVYAIKQMPKPTDVNVVQRLLGRVNYLAKICRLVSDHCQVLRQRTQEWDWTAQHEASLRLEETIVKALGLKYSNTEEEPVAFALTGVSDTNDTQPQQTTLQNQEKFNLVCNAYTK